MTFYNTPEISLPRRVDDTELLHSFGGENVEWLTLNVGGSLVLLACEIMGNNTKVFEVMNGPYPGTEVDRVML